MNLQSVMDSFFVVVEVVDIVEYRNLEVDYH
jgi:hypothetical protein